MNLYRIIIPVSDIEQAVGFYSFILHQSGSRVSEGRHYYSLGGVVLAIYDPVADGDEAGSRWSFHENQYIYIATDEIEAVYERVKSSPCRYVDSSIETMPWGERLFYANDPFGTPLCFVDEQTVFLG